MSKRRISARQKWRLEMQTRLLKEHYGRQHPIKVIDLGTEYGHTGRYVREAFPNAEIVGVEVHEPTIIACRQEEGQNYNALIHIDALAFLATFESKADVIIAAELIEHLSKEDGLLLLRGIAEHSHLGVVTSPMGFKPQGPMYGNPYQNHISGWEQKELAQAGWDTYALMPGELSTCSCAIYTKKSSA